MRVYASNNDPLDFCQDCTRQLSEAKAREKFGNLGDGPDGRGNCFSYDTEHPDYDGEGYDCNGCGKRLETEDN